MQRVSALLPSWDRSRSSTSSARTNSSSLDKVRGWTDRIPSNRLSTLSRPGKEAFWPASLDKECEKAARILRSFCSDGFRVPDERPSSPTTASSSGSTSKFLKKIPPRIVQNAVGLAVFTSMRTGLWTAGSGGNGILIARKEDGTWSPPSGLMLQTPSLGFVLGVDIYDCVVVINTFSMLEAFGKSKVILGSDVAMAPGPVVSLGLLENEVRWADLSETAFTYMKAKGQSANAKLDGTVLTHRTDENERFYGADFSVPKILAGDVNQSLPQLRSLTEVLKLAEGRTDYDTVLIELLASMPAPSDMLIDSPGSVGCLSPSFGLPKVDDPDPFGVLALEKAGLEIREAGTGRRPESTQFDYVPSPASSMFPRRSARRSGDTFLSKSNRGSYMSNKTMASHMTDAGTQTEAGSTPETTPSPSQSDDGHPAEHGDLGRGVKESVEVDYTQIDISALRNLSAFPDLDMPLVRSPDEDEDDAGSTDDEDEDIRPSREGRFSNRAKPDSLHEAIMDEDNSSVGEYNDREVEEEEKNKDVEEKEKAEEKEAEKEDEKKEQEQRGQEEEEEEEEEEEPVVFEVATAQPPARMASVAAQAMQVKGSVVTIPRRVPPPLPTRSPARLSFRNPGQTSDANTVGSPLKQEFELGTQGEEATTPTTSQDAMSDAASSSDSDAHSEHSGEKGPERSVTPTQDMVTRLSKSFTISKPMESTSIQSPAKETDKVEMGSSHAVPVSVA